MNEEFEEQVKWMWMIGDETDGLIDPMTEALKAWCQYAKQHGEKYVKEGEE